jgi:hypothetical protein
MIRKQIALKIVLPFRLKSGILAKEVCLEFIKFFSLG